MIILRLSQATVMPWKNGKGQTAQIAISPAEAQFPADDFIWRLSSAQITQVSEFSQFPGYDRWLAIREGILDVNGQQMGPFEVLNLHGEDPVQARPVLGPVKDFGLIFRRDKILLETEMKSFPQSLEQKHNLDESTHLWILASGQLQIDDAVLNPGDTMLVQGVRGIVTKAGPDARSFCLKLKKVGGYFKT